MVHSRFCELKIDLSKTQHLIDISPSSREYPWRIFCYPRGRDPADNGEYVSLCLALKTPRSINDVILDAFVMGKGGAHARESGQVISTKNWGHTRAVMWDRFVKRSDLEQLYGATGVATVVCGVMVFSNNPLAIPASNIVKHLGDMLDCTDGSDVSFSVGGKIFHAHRAVLAARSAVFKAELFGSMAEAQMPCITLHEIDPATFERMLRFIYTDALPTNLEFRDTPIDVFHHLLAAADRYAVDRLKLVCAKRILDSLSVDTVAIALDCALMYNCPELKDRCMDFFVAEANFKKAVLTEDFLRLGQKFPAIIAELRNKARA
jgi:speckle-type POZ protein